MIVFHWHFDSQFSSGFAVVQTKVDDCDGLMRSCECPAADLANFATGTDHPCASSDSSWEIFWFRKCDKYVHCAAKGVKQYDNGHRNGTIKLCWSNYVVDITLRWNVCSKTFLQTVWNLLVRGPAPTVKTKTFQYVCTPQHMCGTNES